MDNGHLDLLRQLVTCCSGRCGGVPVLASVKEGLAMLEKRQVLMKWHFNAEVRQYDAESIL
jgi:hypothetical protein